MSQFLMVAGIGVGCYAAGVMGYKLFDNGLANGVCVESLRHGTNLISYTSIRLRGGDPNRKEAKYGSTYGLFKNPNVNNYFYVFKDTEYDVLVANEHDIIRKAVNFFLKALGLGCIPSYPAITVLIPFGVGVVMA